MITLSILLGVLCTAGLDATVTTVQTTQGTTVTAATVSPTTTNTTAAATAATTATTPAATTTVSTNSTATTGTKTTNTPTGSTTNTVPTTKITTAASLTPQTTNLAVTVVNTTQQSQQTAAATTIKTDNPGNATITSQPSVSKNVTYSTKTDQSTTQATNVSGPGEKQSTAAILPPTVGTVTYTASSTASETSQKSKATDAAKTTDISTPALKSTLAPLSRMMPLTTSSKSPADPSNYNLISTVLSPRTTASVFIAERTYKDNISVKCQRNYSGSFVKLNMKASRICTSAENTAKDEEDEHKSFMYLCKALKPGYHPSKDKCKIVLASHDSDQLAIVDAFVENHLDPNELYEQLKTIKKKDNNSLFSFDNIKDNDEDLVSIPLISAIVSLAVVLLIIAAIYGCWHQRQTWKREQRLTEELQTMENGYHDNPTLEVMETSPEMQEKKGGLNGELGDSWIVPLDNLTRDDLDEEDTHL